MCVLGGGVKKKRSKRENIKAKHKYPQKREGRDLCSETLSQTCSSAEMELWKGGPLSLW